MQPDLPWNVAGIPPEAREAARAAARREGLSVGEWLTRRILKSLTDGGADSGTWTRAAMPEFRPPVEETRDTEDMLARVSRSETESSATYRRLEEQLRSLARRLEAAERSQSENSRAVNQAATEINIAAREQAQAFDQLGAHVVGLGDRVARIERGAGTDGVKDAVKGLHAGLSRLADQITETAGQSANQIAALARNVETVAGKAGEARLEAENVARTLSARMAAFDDRLRAAESAAQACLDKLDKTGAGIEAVERNAQAESQRQAQLLAQLSDALDKLSTRITTSEAQTAGAMARLEDQIAHVESRQNEAPIDRRLQGIEHTLSDLAGRLESTERSASSAARNIEDSLRSFSSRLDDADKRQREAAAAQPVPQQPASPQPIPPPPAAPSFDLPPFPETPAPSFAVASEDLPPFHGPGFTEPPPFADADAFTPAPPVESADSYIAAARRSARAAAEAQGATALGGFSWAAPAAAEKEPATKSGASRFVLVAGIVIIAIGAVVAGILLSRGLVGNTAAPPMLHRTSTATDTVQAPPVQAAPASDDIGETTAPQTAPAPMTSPQTSTAPHSAASVPGSPVIAPRQAPKTTRVVVKPAPIAALQAPQAAAQHAPAPALAVQLPKQVSPLERLSTLAGAGSAKAELLLGLKFLDGDGTPVNEAEAAKWLERAANQGEAIAAYRLGTLYERGHGVPADAAKAMRWYATAAKLGNRKAMHNLAVAYAEGSGTPKDLTQAAQWFSKAAALGLADSEFNLAVLYERGMGVQQSLIDAYKWYAIAAAQGDSESKARLDVIATQLSPDERAAAQKAAAEFRPLPLDHEANVPPDPSVVE